MTNKVNLIYKLEGPKVDEGIDVFELSPLLLSLGKLIQNSNEIVNPTGKKIGVNIKPFQKGSFVIEILVFAQTNLQQLISYVNHDDVQQIKQLIEWLGLIGGGTTGVIAVYKFLKGRPKRIDAGPEEVKITAQNDTSITVDKQTYSLFQNSDVQQNIYNIYGDFLGKEGINKVKSFLKDEGEQKAVTVEKNDVPYFNPANAIMQEDAKENEKRNITQCFIKPKRISVEGEADNWSFRKGVDTVITATIKDEEFLSKIKTGEIRLYGEDLLEVNLLEIQTVKNNEVYAKYEVIKVTKYIKAPVQKTLLE